MRQHDKITQERTEEYDDTKDAMATALGLSASQKTAVADLMTAQHTEAHALMEKLRTDGVAPDAAHTQIKALREKHGAALSRILNPTQMEIVKIHDAIGHHGRGGHRGGGPRDGSREGAASPNGPTNGGGANLD